MNHLDSPNFHRDGRCRRGPRREPPQRGADAERGEAVHFRSDGLNLSPAEYPVVGEARGDGRAGDDRSCGGCVTELEERFAKALGKERRCSSPRGRWPTTWPSAARRRGRAECLSRPRATSTATRSTASRPLQPPQHVPARA